MNICGQHLTRSVTYFTIYEHILQYMNTIYISCRHVYSKEPIFTMFRLTIQNSTLVPVCSRTKLNISPCVSTPFYISFCQHKNAIYIYIYIYSCLYTVSSKKVDVEAYAVHLYGNSPQSSLCAQCFKMHKYITTQVNFF